MFDLTLFKKGSSVAKSFFTRNRKERRFVVATVIFPDT